MKIVLFDFGNVANVFVGFIKNLYLFYMADKRPPRVMRGLIKHYKHEYPHLSEREILSLLRKVLGDDRTFWERFLASDKC